jgi:hypothetical protein
MTNNSKHRKLKQLLERAMQVAAEKLISSKKEKKQSILIADGNKIKEIPFQKLGLKSK